MGQLVVFNASGSAIYVSFNNGGFIEVPSVDTASWNPAQPATEPNFVNNTNPGAGQLGLGNNTLTIYPATSGPASSANFTLEVPVDVPVSAVQLYLFWKSATSVAWVALNSGQPFQVSFITQNPSSVSTISQSISPRLLKTAPTPEHAATPQATQTTVYAKL